MALTLLEANKLNDGDIKRQAVIQMFAENSEIMRVLPIENIQGGSLSYNKEGKLPGVAFRGYNEGYTGSEGVLNPESETLRIIGGSIDVDRAIIKTRGLEQRSNQEEMQIKAIILNLTGKFITGDSEVDSREFDGLRKRIVGDQLVAANLNAPAANSPLSLEALDEAIDRVDSPTHLLMSKRMRNKLTRAARDGIGGDIDYMLDEFGRRVMMYNGIPVLIVDYDGLGQKIINFNEAGPAGGAVSQSLYVVSFGTDKVTGLQNGGLDILDLGEVPDKPVMRTRMEWLFGLAVMHGRAASRLWGITDGAITS